MKVRSPLRYPGGKAKFFSAFCEIVSANSLFGAHYKEPFAGGGGVAIPLLCHGFVDSITLNDIDSGIASFWKFLIEDPGGLCALVRDAELSVEEWKRQRAVYLAGGDFGDQELAFATFYLNRTSRSGIISGSGPIGGYNQAGKWKLDARFNKSGIIKNIERSAEFSSQIKVENSDGVEFIRKARVGDFLYIDPPYYEKGQRLYRNYYSHKDHVDVHTALNNCASANWVVSYDDVPEIRKIYAPSHPLTVRLNYSAGNCRVAEEIVYLGSNLTPPKHWIEPAQAVA